jgi:hypothetical protein
LPEATRIAFVTFTVGHDAIDEGRSALVAMLARLRRMTCWRHFVDGGRGRIEILVSRGAGRTWNVHVHLLVLVDESCPIDVGEIQAAWTAILGDEGLRGSFEWDWVEREHVSVPSCRRKGLFSPPGFYTTKRRAEWLDVSDDELRQVVRDIPGRRMAIRFGRWPKLARMRHDSSGGRPCPAAPAVAKPEKSNEPCVAPVGEQDRAPFARRGTSSEQGCPSPTCSPFPRILQTGRPRITSASTGSVRGARAPMRERGGNPSASPRPDGGHAVDRMKRRWDAELEASSARLMAWVMSP